MQQFVTFLGTKSAFLGASFLRKQTFVEKLVKIVKFFKFCSYKLEQNEQIIAYFYEINNISHLILERVINTVPVFGVSRNQTLLVDSQDSVVLAQAFESLRFPLEQGESFSD